MHPAPFPFARDLVLLGGGHAHVGVLRSFGMRPLPGVRLTLICRDVHTPYSGMLPGLVAGHYLFDETHIDLARLCRFAGARFIHDEALGLDLGARRLACRERPPVRYDVLSINTGSTPDTSIPGAAEHAIPVKPINRFLAGWEALRRRVGERGAARIATVGGGPGGVEIMLAVRHALAADLAGAGRPTAALECHLVAGEDGILPHHPAGARQAFRDILGKHGIRLHEGAPVVRVEAGRLHTAAGKVVEADEILWVTAAAAPDWPRAAGLAVDPRGFIQVNDRLQSVSHPELFAAGDIASLPEPRPKSGVFAVREAPALAENLRRALRGEALRPFRPQDEFLTIVTTGPKHAIAARGRWWARGRWVWHWKDRIDRRFMDRYERLPDMAGRKQDAPVTVPGAPAEAMRCAGCGAKVGSDVLGRALARIAPLARPEVRVGLDGADDAAVLAVPAGRLLVQSVDHFRALVDDPYLFGRIAANHALGDLYAMGAEPMTALAIATVPYAAEALVEDVLHELLAGANRVLREAGAGLIGGHSAEGPELAFGLTVNGTVDPERILRKGGLAPGDRLILTKPLGTGALFAAHMRLKAKGREIEEAIAAMLVSNRTGAAVLQAHGASACTDVTGFGLAGHLAEMLAASGPVGADVSLSAVPFLAGALPAAEAGVFSSLQPQNLRIGRNVAEDGVAAGDPRRALLFDPQTAGGLLAGVPEARAEACVRALREAGYERAAVVGTVQALAGAAAPIVLHA